MRNLMPDFIYSQYKAHRDGGQFQAASVFVDMSGFTALTETLMQHRKDGAEVLTAVLNNVFGPLVETVYRHGGFISTFAGDAFTALFPLNDEAAAHAAQVAFSIRQFFTDHGLTHTPYGSFALGVKVGLGIGQVEWGIWGTSERAAYFFRGPAVDGCAQAEHQATAGEIVAKTDFAPHLPPEVQREPLGDYFRLGGQIHVPPARRAEQSLLTRETQRPFVMEAVIDLIAPAEFRDVASVFMSLDESGGESALRFFTEAVLEETAHYGGYFNKLDFGDKGGTMLVLFGAPTAHENDLARAADFLLALQNRDTGIRWRAGLTFGTVYAGFLGGEERSEYTAIGDVVNLSARLMMGAAWGAVWVSPQVAETLAAKGYPFEPVGDMAFKGKSQPVAVSRLMGKPQEAGEAVFTGALVGREAELRRLEQLIEPIFRGQFAGMVYVYGEPGMGKSRLVHELRQRLPRASWFTCPADEILRQSLNPFKYFLRQYFDQSARRTTAANRARFDELLAGLIGRASEPARRELERTRSFLGALVDLRWPGSLYELLEPKLRFENTLSAFKTLILAESLGQPVIIQIEDAHWLDSDSQEMVKTLTRSVAESGFAVILTSRYRDDGSPFVIPVADDAPQTAVDLNRLSDEGVRDMAAQVLAGGASESLAAFLAEKTEGNPFFVEQLALDLQERSALTQDEKGEWKLVGQAAAEVPTNINAVLVARLDRLATQVKTIVQTAAVLGQEFEVLILSEMLKGDAELSQKVRQAEGEAIWQAMSEIRYLFRHVLLRDAAYDMQLRARLREMHQLAGEAIEHVYADALTQHYTDLAYHYGKAEKIQPEHRYTWLAGEQAAASYANAQALGYFSRTLELTPDDDLSGRYDVLLAREKVYDVQAARGSQLQDIEAQLALAEKLDDNRRRAEVALRQAHYAYVTSDFSGSSAHAQRAIALAQAAGAVESEAAGYLRWGTALWSLADYPAARIQLEKALTLAQAARLPAVEADVLRNLGNVALYEGNYAQAQSYYEPALSLFRAIGSRRGEGSTLNQLGHISYFTVDFPSAERYYQEALRLYTDIGDRQGEGIALNGLGLVNLQIGDFAQARSYYEPALRLFRDSGHKQGQSAVLSNLGLIAIMEGNFAQERVYVEQTLRLNREIGDRHSEGVTLFALGFSGLRQGDYDRARDFYEQSLRLRQEIGDRRGESETLAYFGLLFHLMGNDAIALDYGQRALAIAHETKSIAEETAALTYVGHALLGLGRPSEAAETYRRVFDLEEKTPEETEFVEALAGLVRALLAMGNVEQAQAHVQRILAYLETDNLSRLVEPLRVYLTCYRALDAAHDRRARDFLDKGYAWLQERAVKFSDEAGRRRFLENVPSHRELIAVWTEMNRDT